MLNLIDLTMAESDCSMSSTNAQLTAMSQSEAVIKDISPIVSSDISSSDSDPSSLENTLTSLTPDPDYMLSQGEYKLESGTQSEVWRNESSQTESSSCTAGQSEDSDLSPQKRRKRISELQGPDWYKHKCFDRYWKHYKQAMTWCQRHFSIMKSMREKQMRKAASTFYPPYNCYMPGVFHIPNQSSSNTMRGRGRGVVRGRGVGRGRTAHSGRRNLPKVGKTLKQKQDVSRRNDETQKVEDTNTAHTEDDSLEMEITDEMLQFFAHSEKHRKERDASKDVTEEGVEIKRVNIETASKKVPTCEAPKERPGMRRTEEMVMLYGKGAAMIHGMETALQMTYDRNTDIKQPKLWPNMPLKLVFS